MKTKIKSLPLLALAATAFFPLTILAEGRFITRTTLPPSADNGFRSIERVIELRPAPKDSPAGVRAVPMKFITEHDLQSGEVLLQQKIIANEIIVRPTKVALANPSLLASLITRLNGTPFKTYLNGDIAIRFSNVEDVTGFDTLIEQVKSSNLVETVFNNAMVESDTLTFTEPYFDATLNPYAAPNDSWFSSQWHLAKIDAPQAWDIRTSAANIRIAIIDTGVDFNHNDLNGNDSGLSPDHFLSGLEPDDSDPMAYDYALGTINGGGHGTWVASLAAAEGNNNQNGSGVAQEAQIYALGVFGWFNIDDPQTPELEVVYTSPASTIRGAIEWCASHNIDVVNLSLGAEVNKTSPDVSFYNSAIQAVSNNGGLVIAAAGNNNRNLNSGSIVPIPAASGASISNMLVVGGSTQGDARWANSNYGDNYVDLFAPGAGIMGLFRTNDNLVPNPNGTISLTGNGTSASAPIVAGAAAILMAEFPSESVSQIIKRLKDSVEKPAGLSGSLAASDGRLNLFRALSPWIHKPESGGWTNTGWFGWIYDDAYPDIQHTSHGWLYQGKADEDNLWFWDYEQSSWWWTNPVYYNSSVKWIYHRDFDGWLLYSSGVSPNRWWQDQFGNWYSDTDLKSF